MASVKQKPHDPVTLIQASARKEAEKADRAATREAFSTFLFLLAVLHFFGHLIVTRSGVPGYGRHLVDLVFMLRDYPAVAGLIVINLFALYYGIHQWRHRYDERERVLPPFPPVPDLRHCNDIYIGSAWTYDGKQPGDILLPGEEVLDPHVVFNEKGLFGNIHVKGGIGSGKTSTGIYPFLDQAIMKYPKPYPPEHFPVGRNGRIAEAPAPAGEEVDPFDRAQWNPYVGMTLDEAHNLYEKLLEEHEKKKWYLLVFDPKKDITQFVLQSAKAAGRENDVIVLRPDAEWSYNPLAITSKELVLAETFMDGIEAVTGSTMHAHYRQTGSEFMANALSIMKTVVPARTTFETLLTLTRKEDLRTQWVNQAIAKMREYQEAEERHRRLGRIYRGPRVNPAAIEFFQHWDEVDSDPTQKRAVTSGIKAQAKFFVDDELRPWLCPAMPPTFKGFHHAIDKGQIVVFQMSIADYKTVSRVLGILLLMDAQAAALSRLDPDSPINKDRVGAHVIDEVANYLNAETKKFISMNRQAGVINMFAHQSQGQLVTDSDKGFEVSFNDNLRSKISYSAPNAVAAGKESQLFGKRLVTKQRYSEGSTMRGVVRTEGGSSLDSAGGEMKSATVSMEEVERSWFEAQSFMTLNTGECIISEFDGNTTKNPRKILAPALWNTARGRRIMNMPVKVRTRSPHPVLTIGASESDAVYLETGLTNTGYTYVETLLDHRGNQRGLKFVTEAGTMIVPIELVRSEPEIYDAIAKQLGDAQGVTLLTDGITSATILQDECNVRFERVLLLPEALHATTEDSPTPLIARLTTSGSSVTTFQDLVRALTGQVLPYRRKGSWEYHVSGDVDRIVEIEETSRSLLDLYVKIGEGLHHMGDDAVEDLYDSQLNLLEDRLQERKAKAEEVRSEQALGVHPGTPRRPTATGIQTAEVISAPGGDKPSKKTRKTTTGRRRRKADQGTLPLFDLEELNAAIKPSPFDEPAANGPEGADPDASHSDTDREDGDDDSRSGGERPLPPTDLDDTYIDTSTDLDADIPAEPEWLPEDDDFADDDYLPEE